MLSWSDSYSLLNEIDSSKILRDNNSVDITRFIIESSVRSSEKESALANENEESALLKGFKEWSSLIGNRNNNKWAWLQNKFFLLLLLQTRCHIGWFDNFIGPREDGSERVAGDDAKTKRTSTGIQGKGRRRSTFHNRMSCWSTYYRGTSDDLS